MSNIYRVIPFRGKIKGKQSAGDVSNQLEEIINERAKEGWEFDQLSSVNIEVQPGCLAGIFGAKVAYNRFDMVIFKKPT
jgi:predicted metalloprotease